MDLSTLLSWLPNEDEDGWYFELRKQRGVLNETQWVCAKTNYRTNKEAFNNIGETPEEAVQKVLEDRLGYTLDKL
jgi:hypothetical protein